MDKSTKSNEFKIGLEDPLKRQPLLNGDLFQLKYSYDYDFSTNLEVHLYTKNVH